MRFYNLETSLHDDDNIYRGPGYTVFMIPYATVCTILVKKFNEPIAG